MSQRLSADDRLRRLLALVPWVAAHDGPTVDDICSRFGLTPEELAAELDLVFLCGVHPFTPDALIEVVHEGDRVFIRYADYFSRPLRLTPEEGLSLVAGGAAMLAVPGADPAGPLARGLAKLAAQLGVEAGDEIEVALGPTPAAVLETLQQAAAEHRRVRLDYYSYGRDERTRRVVDPHAVFAADGEWYLAAFDHDRGEDRRFRVDRVNAAEVLDETFDPPASPPEIGVYRPGADDPRVVLELAPSARWVVEQYPVEATEELGDGRLRVTLAASEQAWLERLLLRLGPAAVVVEGADGVAASAAERILERYRSA